MAITKTKRKLTLSGLVIISVAILLFATLGSCQISYLTQAMAGHFRIMHSRKSIEKILKTNQLSIESQKKLKLVLEIHEYAIRELSLPDNKSYTVYAEIEDQYPGWNVYCAPKLSIEPKTWCYPIAGCVVYHGYFKKEKAFEFAEKMKQEGYDVYVSPFTAYSTLGWYKDPILSTHLTYDSLRLAGLIIHELAHQKFYVSGDSQVSEGFAVTVERAGVLSWLRSLGRDDQITEAIRKWDENDQIVKRLLKTRNELNAIYLSTQNATSMLHKKDSIMHELERDLFQGKKELNNAFFVPISTYHSLVPQFQSLLDSCGGNFPQFYSEMQSLLN